MSERHRGFDVGRRDAPNRILWIHGYTGSPDAFIHTAERLALELDAHVLAPLLPGHGTVETRLLKHSFKEFYASARYFARALSGEKPCAYLGYSFGGYIAALLATEFKPQALALALTPYSLRFPFWIPGFAALLEMRSLWDKYFTAEDIRIREGTFYYRHLPGKSLSLIHEGNQLLHDVLPKLKMPIFTLHNEADPLAAPDSGIKIITENGNRENEYHVLPGGRHALFFRPERELEEKILIAFFKKHLQKTAATHEVSRRRAFSALA